MEESWRERGGAELGVHCGIGAVHDLGALQGTDEAKGDEEEWGGEGV